MTVSGLFLRTTTAGLFFRKLVSKMEEREEPPTAAAPKEALSSALTVRPPVEGIPSKIKRKEKK